MKSGWNVNGQLMAKLKKIQYQGLMWKKAIEFEADTEVRQGQNCIKLEVYSQSGV